MHSPGINGEGELSGQPANPGSPGKMAVKTECVCITYVRLVLRLQISGTVFDKYEMPSNVLGPF